MKFNEHFWSVQDSAVRNTISTKFGHVYHLSITKLPEYKLYADRAPRYVYSIRSTTATLAPKVYQKIELSND